MAGCWHLRIGCILLGFVLIAATPASAAISELGSDVLVWEVPPAPDGDVYQPIAGLDPVNGNYLLAWIQDEDDIAFRAVGAMISAAGGTVAFPFEIDDGTGNSRELASAFDRLRQRHLIVWVQDSDAAGAFEIHGRLFSSTLSPVGAPFKISDHGASSTDTAFDAIHPDVAADGEGGFVVVWAADDDVTGFGNGVFDLYSRHLDSTGTFAGPQTRLTDVTSNGAVLANEALRPAIAFNPVQENYALVYEADLDGDPVYGPGLFLLPLNLGGIPKSGSVKATRLGGGLAKGGVTYERDLDIAFDHRQKQFLAVWETNLLDPTQESIAGQIILSNYNIGSGVITIGDYTCKARDAAVVYSPFSDRFLVTWSGSPTAAAPCPVEREILAREVEGATPQGTPLVISTTGPGGDLAFSATTPTVVPHPTLPEAFAMWSGDPTLVGDFRITGQFLSMDVSTSVPATPELPRELSIAAAPNPFNPATTVRFGVPRDGRVRLRIYDARGALVRTLVEEDLSAGTHRRRWNGTDDNGRAVASGVYFGHIESAGEERKSRFVLLK